MKIFKYLFIILLTIILSNCEEQFYSEVETPKNNIEPKIVIHSYISPLDEKVTVSVKLSKALFSDVKIKDEDYKQITNSTVRLKNLNTSKSIRLDYNSTEKNYVTLTNDFKIEEKTSYQLTVTTPGHKTVTAECTVPSIMVTDITNIKIKKKLDNDETIITFEIKDNPIEKNYYLAYLENEVEYDDYNSEILEYNFTDENKNGKTIIAKPINYFWGSVEIKKTTAKIKSVDKNYYNYIKSVNNQIDTGENPFSEPVILISNIKGGLGVFGAYTLKTTTKTF